LPPFKDIVVRGFTPNFDFNLYGVIIVATCLLILFITIPISATTSANLEDDDEHAGQKAEMPNLWWLSPVLAGFFTASLLAMLFPYKICELSRIPPASTASTV